MSEQIPVVEPSMRTESGEATSMSVFELQTPERFRETFVTAVNESTPGDQVALEVMQFEITDNTKPIFEALIDAKNRGVEDVRFHYDRVARRHIRNGDDQAWAIQSLGRTVVHRGGSLSEGGDRLGLRKAYEGREEMIDQLEAVGITDPSNKLRGDRPHLSHNHVKLAIVGDTAWMGTMNLRDVDFDISNFMLKITDPSWVATLKGVFEQTETDGAKNDLVLIKEGDTNPDATRLFLDVGVKRQSVILSKAIEMVDSLQDGDELIMIGQWPPLRMVYGELVDKMLAKMASGVEGTFLLSPKTHLHPSRKASLLLQKSVEKKQEAVMGMNIVNLARPTHCKAMVVRRSNGEVEVLFGSHNFTARTVNNGTREIAMWSKDVEITNQIVEFLDDIRAETV